jgi:hypothetical protein
MKLVKIIKRILGILLIVGILGGFIELLSAISGFPIDKVIMCILESIGFILGGILFVVVFFSMMALINWLLTDKWS